ncbi:MAG: SdrD B-like domain-containing protein, partial [Gemmataceae bacterium]
MSDQQGQPDPEPAGTRLTLRDASGQVLATVGSSADGVYSFNGLMGGPPPAPPSRLSGSVYLDVNRDGQRGPGEPGFAGIVILLTGTEHTGKAVRRQAATDPDGRYLFDEIAPGFYRLEPLTPVPHTQPGRCTVGSLGGQEQAGALQVAVQGGQQGERYDFARV